MSANGVFSSTLDYEFFGGGYSVVSGGISGSLEASLNSAASVSIYGESNNSIDFSFSSLAGTPTLRAEFSGSIDFTVTSTVEFGVQRWATVAGRIDFSANSEASSLVQSYADYSFDISLSASATQFSLGEVSGFYTFDVSGIGLNISTHVYDLIGRNEINFVSGLEHNDVTILSKQTDVKLLNGDKTYVEII